MKKILLILCFLPLLGFGQVVQFMSDCVITTDSTWILPIPEAEDYNYNLGIQVEWHGLAGILDGELIIRHTMADDSLSCDYGLSEPLTAATGYVYFELYEVTSTEIQLFFDVNNITTGTVNAWAIFKRSR
jgi:hypothetical protein